MTPSAVAGCSAVGLWLEIAVPVRDGSIALSFPGLSRCSIHGGLPPQVITSGSQAGVKSHSPEDNSRASFLGCWATAPQSQPEPRLHGPVSPRSPAVGGDIFVTHPLGSETFQLITHNRKALQCPSQLALCLPGPSPPCPPGPWHIFSTCCRKPYRGQVDLRD